MRIWIGGLAALALLLAGCALHFYDKREEPVVTVGGGLRPVITWTPPTAYELNMYAGDKDGDGLGVLWTAKMPGGFANTLPSPVTYGVPPAGSAVRSADPLEPGKTYTVVVFRKDPKRQGDGFTSTGYRYVGTATFVATE